MTEPEKHAPAEQPPGPARVRPGLHADNGRERAGPLEGYSLDTLTALLDDGGPTEGQLGPAPLRRGGAARRPFR
jgi:hypothetical protein